MAKAPHDVGHTAHGFVQPARVEQAGVQVMGVAVIAQLKAKHTVAALKQRRRRGQHVLGLGAAFPAVNQDGQRPVVAACAVKAGQRDAVAGVKLNVAGVLKQAARATRDERRAQLQAGERGLDVPVGQRPAGRERAVQRGGHRARFRPRLSQPA